MNEQDKIQHFAVKIEEFFKKYPQKFLMYVGGSGGEFFAVKISEYSPEFDYSEYFITEHLNRWHQILPPLFSSVVFTKLLEEDNMLFYENVAKSIISRDSSKTIDEIIQEAETFIEQGNKKILIRTHLSWSPFFDKTNTYYMLPDTPEVFDYANKLRVSKVYQNDIDLEHLKRLNSVVKPHIAFQNIGVDFDTNSQMLAAIDWLEQKNINAVKEIFIDCLSRPMIAKEINYKFEEFFSLSFHEVLDQYSERLLGNYENKFKIMNEASKNTNVLLMSKLFKPGYLEDIFNITDENFRKDVTDWHLKNLKVLRDIGFQVDKFNFHLD